MPKFLRRKNVRTILKIVGIILGIALVVYLIFAGRHYFTRRGIRQIQNMAKSYGVFSPLVIFFLIFISTVIPPLPIPTPLVEMAAGYLYGFLPAFFIVWMSQIISSVSAYTISRFVGKRFFKKVLKNPIITSYQSYIKKHGSTAVFIARSTLSSPFSIVDILAGLSNIPFWSFALATALGTIIESVLYSFIGSFIHTSRLRLWFVFILVVILGVLGPILTIAMTKVIKPKRNLR